MSLLPSVKDAKLCYSLFRSFVFRYLERFYCIDSSVYLHLSLRMFSLLLMFVDPVLANHLNDEEFYPEFYSIQWFLTLFSRTLPLPHVLRLWDILIAVDDPAFTFYIGICLLRKNRDLFLSCSREELPEKVKNLKFNTEDEIDLILKNALELYNQAPRSILRYLRLCCVSSIELSPSPYNFLLKKTSNNLDKNSPEKINKEREEEEKEEIEINKKIISDLQKKRVELEEYDQMLAIQCSRSCLTLNPKELIESYLNSSNHYSPTTINTDESSTSSSEDISSKTINELVNSTKQSQQYIIIDIRTEEEREASGGGSIPRAINFSPTLLSDFNATLKWIQHYDLLNGINLVLLDMPPSKWTGISLIRRLILGEGDGILDNNMYNSEENLFYYKNYIRKNKENYFKYIDSLPIESSNNKNLETLNDNLMNELNRPSFLLASLLQTYSFSKILIVDDGYPGLIFQFQNLSLKLEPMIIDFEEKRWIEYLKKSGRYYIIENIQKKRDKVKKLKEKNNSKENEQYNPSSSAPSSSSSTSSVSSKNSEEQTELDRIKRAIEVALKYNHEWTYKHLVKKLEDTFGKEAAFEERQREKRIEQEKERELQKERERQLVFFADLL